MEFDVYSIGKLNFNYPDLKMKINFDGKGNKDCRFLKTSNGVGVIIDGSLAWAIGLKKGVSLDKKILFYKKSDIFYVGFVK